MTENVLGLIFGIERSTFSKNLAIALRALSSALLKINVMPMCEFASIEAFEKHLEAHPEIIIDGSAGLWNYTKINTNDLLSPCH